MEREGDELKERVLWAQGEKKGLTELPLEVSQREKERRTKRLD